MKDSQMPNDQNPTISPERIEILRGLTPKTGSHPKPDDDTPIGCEVELLSWAARMKWSAAPPCISPVVAAFLRRWNDSLNEAGRIQLHKFCLDHVTEITSTGDDNKDEDRSWMAIDWMIRLYTPAWLELAGINESSSALQALSPITADTVKAAQPKIDAARETAQAAAGTAYSSAAGSAVVAAAGSAVCAVSRAARSASNWTAGAEAGSAAYAASLWAARASGSGNQKLPSTVTILQASALELLNRMISQ